jgi:hypothetical protein
MRTSWKLINKELGKDCKNYGFLSLNINGRCITNHQSIANALNNHFITFPTRIIWKINTNNFDTRTSGNTQNNSSFALGQVFRNSFLGIK